MYSPISLSSSSTEPGTPGSQAVEAAKNMKDLAVFKKPIGIAKRSKAKILDEDTYIEKMGEIIQRDFFPHLEKLKAQNEYLEALENHDMKKMRELYEKYSLVRPMTDRPASPATFETPVRKENENVTDTPVSTISKESKNSKSKSPNESDKSAKIGLDAFLGTHTSEDNASFEEILVENEIKHRLKHAWLYKGEENSSTLAIKSSDSLKLAITNGENEKNKKPLELDTWTYKNKNYIMYIPDGVELTSEEKVELAKKRQQVVHSNTRINFNPFDEVQNKEAINELSKNHSKSNDGKIGVDGKEIVRNETPRVNGFTFVATPSPMPGVCDSPIMTWGQIEGTPFRLDGGDTPLLHVSSGPSFKMSEPPKREKIALELAEKASERNRDKKMKALNAARRSLATPSPRSTIDRLNTMSPAARRLATQKLRLSVSPSPNRTPNLIRTPLIGSRTPKSPRVQTPLVKSTKDILAAKQQSPVLTDNLLQLPQRQRAADFFY